MVQVRVRRSGPTEFGQLVGGNPRTGQRYSVGSAAGEWVHIGQGRGERMSRTVFHSDRFPVQDEPVAQRRQEEIPLDAAEARTVFGLDQRLVAGAQRRQFRLKEGERKTAPQQQGRSKVRQRRVGVDSHPQVGHVVERLQNLLLAGIGMRRIGERQRIARTFQPILHRLAKLNHPVAQRQLAIVPSGRRQRDGVVQILLPGDRGLD